MDEAFKSGQIVRNVVPVYGEVLAYDPQKTNQEPTLNPGKSGGPGARHGETVEIPVGHTGEVLSSTEFETVAIYPIHSTGELEPHMVKVESFTSDFKRARRHNPFKLDRSGYGDPGKPIQASAEDPQLKWAEVVFDPETSYLIDDDINFPIKPVDVDKNLPYVRQDEAYYETPLEDKISPDLIPLFEEEWGRWEQFGDPTRPPVSGASRAVFFYNGYIRKVPIHQGGRSDNNREYEEFSSGSIPIPIARMEMEDSGVIVQEEVRSVSDDLMSYLEEEGYARRTGFPLEEDSASVIVEENPWVRAMRDDPQVGFDAGGELRAFDSFDSTWLDTRHLEEIQRQQDHLKELERLRRMRHEDRDRDVRGDDGRIKWTYMKGA